MPTSASDIAHLLRRSGFGTTRSEVTNLARLTLTEAVDTVLNTSAAPADVPPPELANAADANWLRYVALVQWWIDRMATTSTPIVEKMTLFWHGHFTSAYRKVADPVPLYRQNALYRTHALGNFATLAQRMALQPAMLLYLDNAENRRQHPNQNFARELLELFLLGHGNYSEDDVAAAARSWTGHSVDWDTREYLFRPEWHDTGQKTFLGSAGNLDGPDIIGIVLTESAPSAVMAKFICAKLWAFFAHPGPVPAGVVDDLATTFLSNGLQIKPVLRALFLRPEFYLPASKQGHVRTPIEYVVSVLRALGVTAATAHPEWYLNDLGQMPFDPPDVSGWKYNGYWLSTATASTKASFATYLTWRLHELGLHPFANCSTEAVNPLLDRAFDLFGLLEPSTTTRSALQTWLGRQRALAYQGWAETPGLFTLMLLAPDLQVG